MPQPIYLDHNANTPVSPEVVAVMRACWDKPLLNPASQHEFGRTARRELERARTHMAVLLGAAPNDGLLFTSGGTESNNLAIRSFLQRAGLLGTRRGEASPPPSTNTPPRILPRHLIISAVEHPSITTLAKQLQSEGHEIDVLPVDAHGVIRTDKLASLLRPDTTGVAAILAQNETGVLQPVAELAAICATRGVPLHTDASQVAGKLPVDFQSLGAATMTVAAHKFQGPIGIGALIFREQTQLWPLLFGGVQQSGIRPGTESVALAAGMCCALNGSTWIDTDENSDSIRQRHYAELLERAARIRTIRDDFETRILAGWPAAQIIGVSAERLPNTSNIAFVGIDRQMLFIALDQAGIACSTGSACASGSSEPSPVHLAMGLEPAVISSALRFSFGLNSTADEAHAAARCILRVCNSFRR
jgi:cysteine desulfurase